MKKIKILSLSLIFIYCAFSCKDKFEAPMVSTDSVTYVTHVSALVNCSMITFGDSHESNTREGICYNTSGNPTTKDFKVLDARWNDTISFEFTNYTAFLSGLQSNTTYYVKAYIEDYEGFNQLRSTTYGQELSFTTKNVDSIVDVRDNQVYKVVKIGEHVWMAENLNYKPISGYYDYENDADKLRFGRLYTYEAGKCACPESWHLPSDIEWQALEKDMGMPEYELGIIGLRGEGVAFKLKESGHANWISNSFSTNESGFTALPGGAYSFIPQQGIEQFEGIGYHAFFLTSTLNEDSSMVFARILYESEIERKLLFKNFGFSVRCVKD